MNAIYLVGQISPKFPETYKWREYVEEYFSSYEEFEIINPCKNNFNKELLEKNSYAITGKNRARGLDLLVPKDYQFVQRSNIAIVNMNHYDLNKPMIGSFYELAWYYLKPSKAVIAFADDFNSYTCQHPFVKQSVTTWCDNVIDACEITKYYF